jgi:hypothetical protein
VRVLLYDRSEAHGLPVHGWPDRLFWCDSLGEALTPSALRGIDIVIIHVTDDPLCESASAACRAGCRVLLFSGDASDAESRKRELRLRDRYPRAKIETIPLRLLIERLPLAMERDDPSLFAEDRIGHVIELLTSLWAIGILWERDGEVHTALHADVSSLPQPGADTRLVSDGRINMAVLGGLRAPSGRTLHDLWSRIYAYRDRPTLQFSTMIVTSNTPAHFYSAVSQLRDVWLTWARG